ncbi:MAG: extracellular solute-binding protein [Treponema sp.]|nr:extracellular solute-binding protein [Treponema sp.]
MKKFLYLSLAFVLAGAALFTGCQKMQKAGEGQVELRVLNYFDMTSANVSKEETFIWEPFLAANPDIKIVREDLFNDPFHNKVEAYAAAGQLPDIIYAWPSGRSSTLHTRKLLKDLTPLIMKDGLDKVLVAGALDGSGQEGGYVGELARAITSSHAFYVNNEVLRDAKLSPAKTYAELKAQVPALRAKGYETVIMANQDTWVMQSCLFSMVAGRFGGEGWEKKILSGKAKFTDPDFVNALKFIKTLYDDEVLSRSSLTTGYGDGIGQFATNKSAYYIDGDWRIGAFITDSSTRQALISPDRQNNFQITVFPDIEGAKINKSTSGILGTGWGINASIPADSPREEAAWRLVKWLSGKEVQSFLLETGGITTSTRTDIDLSSIKLEPLQVAGSNLAMQYSITTSVIDGAFVGPVHEPINDGLQAIGMGTQTPEQVAQAAQKALEAWKVGQ